MSRSPVLFLAALLPVPLAVASCRIEGPLILLNTSPSEPIGLYRRVEAAPRVGRLIAYRPPAAARAYVASAMPGRAGSTFLKSVVAGEGAQACIAGADLVVNGLRLGAVSVRDRAGRDLPRWRGCHRLATGELLVFSDRIPNSFDSRYYGPVSLADVVGVYTPLWVAGTGPDQGRAS